MPSWDALIGLGVALIFLGFMLVFLGVFLGALSGSMGKVEGGGVVMIGPIPIIFGTSERIVLLAMVLTLIMIIVYAVLALYNKRIMG